MILSGHTLIEMALEGREIVSPFLYKSQKINGMSAGVSHAGYDIRCKQGLSFNPRDSTLESPSITHYDQDGEMFDITMGRFAIASSVEKFKMPNDVIGIVHDKSTWARRGLSVFNTVIEPGWEGYLTLEFVFHGEDPLTIMNGDPIAQVVFHRVDKMVSGYSGKYQNQEDKPVHAILEPSTL